MKNYKKIVPIAVVVLMLLSTFQAFKGPIERHREIKSALKQAESYREQKLYTLAEKSYEEAIALSEKPEYYEKAIEMYMQISNHDKAIKWTEKMKNDFPENPRAYELLLEAYINNEDYSDAFDIFDEIKAREITSDKITTLWNENKFAYKTSGANYTDIERFSGKYGKATNGEKYCILKQNGKRGTQFIYDRVGFFANDMCPVLIENVWYFIGTDFDYKANLSYNFDFEISEVGLYSSEMYPISDGKQYHYSNLNYELLYGPFDYAGSFNNGVAAVKKGNEWFLIGTDGENIAGPYESILLDERGICSIAERCFVKENGAYYLIDIEGNKVTDTAFQDAKLFINSKETTAVKINNKWNYIDVSGTVTEMPEVYEDANAFSCGLALASKGGFYGFIDSNGSWIIEPKYKKAISFNSNGCAFVYDDTWTKVLLYQYN